MNMKNKICKECGKSFKPQRPLQMVCSNKCAYKYAAKKVKDKQVKEFKKWSKETKENLRTHSDYIKILQVVFNKYIRKRDENEGCISCGVKIAEEFHAGHYIPKTYQYLRFNEFNVNLQCSRCNTYLRGNQVAYRENLIKKIGKKKVEKLESDRHLEFKLSIDELKELIIFYRKKLKE